MSDWDADDVIACFGVIAFAVVLLFAAGYWTAQHVMIR